VGTIDLAGRTLEYADGGDPAGAPVLVHHGTPGAAVLHPGWEEIARVERLRLVIHSRPGYGTSGRAPGRSVGDVAGDAAALADALGIDRFLTFGFSGGGPHALACAALLPGRVVAAVVLASVAPHDADGLEFLAGMGAGNVDEFGRAERGEEPLRELLEAETAGLLGATQQQLSEAMAGVLTPADADELAGPIGATLLRHFQHGMAISADGWVDDDLAFVRPWGFDLAAVGAPVQLWQGRLDAMVPFAHGEWMAEHVPGADAHLSEDDGHLSLLTRRAPEWLRWLRAQWDARA
jgi:pimeloyl-ACP methyl ester carboxylesterase